MKLKNQNRFLPFEEARGIVRGLGLKKYDEWREWSKSGERPLNIPGAPYEVYKNNGWINNGDWLGIESRQFMSFYLARDFVRKLGLKNWAEWNEWSKSGERPSNIPSTPNKMYKNKGWIDYRDWMGIEPQFIGFDQAREIVRKLKINSFTFF